MAHLPEVMRRKLEALGWRDGRKIEGAIAILQPSGWVQVSRAEGNLAVTLCRPSDPEEIAEVAAQQAAAATIGFDRDAARDDLGFWFTLPASRLVP